MIFVSHCSADTLATRRLVFELLHLGPNVWVDDSNLASAVRVFEEIDQGIRESSLVLFVISREALSSEYVHAEVGLAERYKKLAFTALLDDVNIEELPPILKSGYIQRIEGSSTLRKSVRFAARSDIEVSANSRRELWVKCADDTFSETPDLAFAPSLRKFNGATRITARLFNRDLHDLQDCSDRASAADTEWMRDGGEQYLRYAQRIRSLPDVAASAARHVAEIATEAVARECDDFSIEYFKAASASLIRGIRKELLFAEYINNPSQQNATRYTNAVREISRWPAPCGGGEVVDLVVSGRLIGTCCAPEYVQAVDLPPGLRPAWLTILPHQLAKLTGCVDGQRLSNAILNGKHEDPAIPDPKSIWIGPH